GVPVLMLANKQDVPTALKLEQIKEIFNQIAERLGARDSRVLPISALEGTGVKDAVEWLFLRVQRNKVNRPPIIISQ
ncbi:ADP-ribosylation factor protein 3, partial [Dissophora globulifera]